MDNKKIPHSGVVSISGIPIVFSIKEGKVLMKKYKEKYGELDGFLLIIKPQNRQ